MKEEIIKKAENLTKTFLEGLAELEKSLTDTIGTYEKSVLRCQDQEKLLKALEGENNLRTQAEIEKLQAEKLKVLGFQKELEKEIASYTAKISDVKLSENKAKELAQGAEEEYKQAAEATKKAKELRDKQDRKLKALEIDDEAINRRKKELSEKEQKLDVREKTLIKQEESLLDREQKCAEMELDLKSQEKRIKFEQKKLKANG